ncbi:probable N-acetylglucosaminyl-phosphatidylinositol de-N-acetylase [Chenopodium quinoa]|nr:probable N-acetylglucosaminyl-phosphatidylinositol de-N-acetylase [Chenopodium quinoa]
MDWFFIVLSASVIWIASLCKILHISYFPTKGQYFNIGDTLHKKAVSLVIAHPDDESMFFTPTINYLTSRGHNIYILCLSTGNADGMGKIRTDELYKACSMLKVPLKQVVVLDHSELQDGFGKVWNHTLIAKIVEDNIRSHGIDTVITFDSYGVSGHCNHRDIHFGIRKVLLDSQQNSFEAWELDSSSVLRKYSGPVDIWLSIFMAWCLPRRKSFCLLNEHPFMSFQAMAQHASQWVWFRKLFVCFSSYTYVNTLQRIVL